METLGLVFKVLWAPGEAMLLVSKKPRVLVPLILLTLVSLGVGISTFSKIDIGEAFREKLSERLDCDERVLDLMRYTGNESAK